MLRDGAPRSTVADALDATGVVSASRTRGRGVPPVDGASGRRSAPSNDAAAVDGPESVVFRLEARVDEGWYLYAPTAGRSLPLKTKHPGNAKFPGCCTYEILPWSIRDWRAIVARVRLACHPASVSRPRGLARALTARPVQSPSASRISRTLRDSPSGENGFSMKYVSRSSSPCCWMASSVYPDMKSTGTSGR
jgi:hypothetical protein